MPSKKPVYLKYDNIAPWFSENRSNILMEKKYLDQLLQFIPNQGKVLDVGCGNGKPILAYLLEQGVQMTGLDGSKELVALAKQSFPTVSFIVQDMLQVQIQDGYDAIIAWHSLFHLTASEQEAMMLRFRDWLKPRGILLMTTGDQEGEAWSNNGGEELYHYSFSPESYQALLEKHGFQVLSRTLADPDCGYASIWICQRT